MRLRALRELGIKEVLVHVVSGWTEEQKKEFIVKDNLNYGDWNYSVLDSWDQDKLGAWGLTTWSLNQEQKEIPEPYTKQQPTGGDAPAHVPHVPSLKLLIDFNINDYPEARRLVDTLVVRGFDFEQFLHAALTESLKATDGN